MEKIEITYVHVKFNKDNRNIFVECACRTKDVETKVVELAIKAEVFNICLEKDIIPISNTTKLFFKDIYNKIRNYQTNEIHLIEKTAYITLIDTAILDKNMIILYDEL